MTQEAQQKTDNEEQTNQLYSIEIQIPKWELDAVRNVAAKRGVTISSYAIKAIRTKMARDTRSNGCFHTGCYNEVNFVTHETMNACLSHIRNEEVDFTTEEMIECIYYNASIFLQGSCQLFSLALHQEFGYEVRTISSGRAFHCYCITERHGKIVYIDVRGATTSFTEFVAGTMLIDLDNFDTTPRDIEEDARLDEEDDDIGFAFAKYIIREYRERYDVSSM